VPLDVAAWTSVSAGFVHSCGVASTGEAFCWVPLPPSPGCAPHCPAAAPPRRRAAAPTRRARGGQGKNDNGQGAVPAELEEPNPEESEADPYRHAPRIVPARWIAVAASYFHSCGITTARRVLCWVRASPPPPRPRSRPTQSAAPQAQRRVRAAERRGARLWAQGSNDAGQAEVPRAVVSALQLSTGFVHNCLLNASGAPVCWGPAPTGEQAYWFQGQTAVPRAAAALRVP
jgi:hypothetical protein